MNHDSQTQPEISGWWFTGFLFLFASFMGVMIAANIGPHAIRVLSLSYLIAVFIAGGALLAMMVTNAVGLGRHWELVKGDTDDSSDPDPRPRRRQELYTRRTENFSEQRLYESESQPESNYLHAEVETTTESEAFLAARRRQPRRRPA